MLQNDWDNLLHQLLGDHTRSSKHSKATILQLLGLHSGKLFSVRGFQAQRIEANITRIVVILQLLKGKLSLRFALRQRQDDVCGNKLICECEEGIKRVLALISLT